MDIKKLILTGSCVAAMGMFSACSDDSASAEPESSSSVQMITSVDDNGNEVLVPASSAVLLLQLVPMSWCLAPH